MISDKQYTNVRDSKIQIKINYTLATSVDNIQPVGLSILCKLILRQGRRALRYAFQTAEGADHSFGKCCPCVIEIRRIWIYA